jgi:hypothetical protein
LERRYTGFGRKPHIQAKRNFHTIKPEHRISMCIEHTITVPKEVKMPIGMITCSPLPKTHTFSQSGNITITITSGSGVEVSLNGDNPTILKSSGLGFSSSYINTKPDDTNTWTIVVSLMTGSPASATVNVTMQAPIA